MIDTDAMPPLVARALRLSLERGYVEPTRSETGRLLQTLAATRDGTIAESGTGCGVGTAWLRAGAPPSTKVVTAEPDHELSGLAARVFADAEIILLTTPWAGLAPHAPFSLIFMDSREASHVSGDAVLEMLEDRGIVVIDDFPSAESAAWRDGGQLDFIRQAWLSDPRFVAAEVAVADGAAVVIAARRP